MNPFDLRVPTLALGAAAVLGALVTMTTLAACGGAASMSAPKGVTGDSSVSSSEGALAALDRAEAEIGRLLGGPAGSPSASAEPVAQQYAAPVSPSQPPPPPPPPQAGAAPPRPSTPPPAKSAAGRREERLAQEGDAPAIRADTCSTACSALASMERAADHLCGLAGDDDTRCKGARVRVKDAGARVHAACPACAR